MSAAGAMLDVRALTVRFGGIAALADVSFGVAAHDIVGLIGPNGAGKTTCFNCITRLFTPDSGSITFRGDDLLRFWPHQIVSRGIARTFQNGLLFDHMSVLDNVLIGLHSRKLGERAALTEAREMLAYLGIAALATSDVHGLPCATRKSVELARALVARPQLLLLDEPAAGLSPEEVTALGTTIGKIRADLSTTILMVEHHMGLVMQVCDRIVVLDSGRTLAEGPPEAIRNDRAVLEAYLGVA